MTDIKPSQAARDAAASVCVLAEMREIVRDGRMDNHPYVQAFAHFEAKARKDERERAVKIAGDAANEASRIARRHAEGSPSRDRMFARAREALGIAAAIHNREAR